MTVSPTNDVLDHPTGQVHTKPATDALLEPALGGSITETALGPATSTPEATPAATRYLRSR